MDGTVKIEEAAVESVHNRGPGTIIFGGLRLTAGEIGWTTGDEVQYEGVGSFAASGKTPTGWWARVYNYPGDCAAPSTSCAHSAVDTGMRWSYCRHCNADMVLTSTGWAAK